MLAYRKNEKIGASPNYCRPSASLCRSAHPMASCSQIASSDVDPPLGWHKLPDL